jgi:hypothetical protein
MCKAHQAREGADSRRIREPEDLPFAQRDNFASDKDCGKTKKGQENRVQPFKP